MASGFRDLFSLLRSWWSSVATVGHAGSRIRPPDREKQIHPPARELRPSFPSREVRASSPPRE